MRAIAERYIELPNTRRDGGQSEVFKAVDLHREGSNVAVKLIPATPDEIHRILFARESAALGRLDHPNVAALLDSGIDQGSGSYFLVFKWIPETLNDWRARQPEDLGWDDVADAVALPLADALAHSHALSVLHRDIKPSNVLFDEHGPVLADFALSKIKDQVAGASDATVIDMTSAPWAPPDQASRGSGRFDVYSLAATLLQCLTAWGLRDYHDIGRALGELNVPPDVERLLRRSLDPNPAARPADGRVFQFELRRIQAARNNKFRGRKTVWFSLKPEVRRSLEQAGSGASAESVISAHLGAANHVVPRPTRFADGHAELTPETCFLVGDQIELTLVFDSPRQKLTCVRAEIKSFEDLDRRRRDANAFVYDRRDVDWSAASPASIVTAATTAMDLNTQLAAAIQDAQDKAGEKIRQKRLDDWSRLIDAKEQFERRLEEPIAYKKVNRSGTKFELEADQAPTELPVDQERYARPLDAPNARGEAVRIVEVDGTAVTVHSDGPADLPVRGVLVRDRTPSQAAIRRQKDALAALREDRCARPHLRELVLDPAVALEPVHVELTEAREGLDEDKKIAVSRALGAPDFFLVQGPPGTGKTSFICELIRQHLSRRPTDTVLLVSQMHVAIDNAITRLEGAGVGSVVRLSGRDENVDPEAAHLLLSAKLKAWAEQVRARARAGMAQLAEREGVHIEHLSLALRAEEALAAIRARQKLAEALGPLDDGDRLDNEDLGEQRAELLAEYLQAESRSKDAVALVQDEAEQLGRVLPAHAEAGDLENLTTGLFGSRTSGRLGELLRAQGDWLASLSDPRSAEPIFLPTQRVVAGTCMGFLANKRVGEMQFDLCIIDEASRATAPELLVPMTRAKRWVLVGDTKQLPPMAEEVLDHEDLVADFDLDKEALTTSLFRTLLAEAPNHCSTSLVTQHRMAVPIGELISEVFYEGRLINDPVPSLDPATVTDANRLVWFSTSNRPDRFEAERLAGSTSASNRIEATQVADLVRHLERQRQEGKYARVDGARTEVLVLTGYSSQRAEIERALRHLDLDHLAVQVKTIDAVQGREADIVIFSVTRSNTAGELGFLSDNYQGRTNVALSRAREVLWIVGDTEFCASRQGPLNRVLSHIKSSQSGKVITL